MQSQTVTQVSRDFGISTRMLRYYEQAGLIASHRREGYAYRMYDEEALRRLRQIQILRKLRIPVKDIGALLGKPDTASAIAVFLRNMREVDEQITALSTIREILQRFVGELQRVAAQPIHSMLTGDSSVIDIIDSLPATSIDFQEDQSMNKLSQASKKLGRIDDARIVYLPPLTVAAAHVIGDDPELRANAQIDAFVREAGLRETKPDLRHFGFNHPNPRDESGYHGYEAWVTVPNDLPVPAPLIKKQFVGGLYAAQMIRLGSFDMWDKLLEWAANSPQYEFAGDLADQDHMCGLLEEHLNYYSHVMLPNSEPEDMQLDLLMPVRKRNSTC